MLSTTRGLNNHRGLFDKGGLQYINILDKTRGLLDINKIKKYSVIYDNEFENNLINEIEEMIKMSPNTEQILDKVYNKYSYLYENNINKFNDRIKDIKLKNEGRLNREDIENELRDRFYWQKHRDMIRPERFKYKSKINIDNL